MGVVVWWLEVVASEYLQLASVKYELFSHFRNCPVEAPGSMTFTRINTVSDVSGRALPVFRTLSDHPRNLSYKFLLYTKPSLRSEGICSAFQALFVNVHIFILSAHYIRINLYPYRALFIYT